MQRALVTGGAGFVGSNLVDTLLGHNWAITAVDNFDSFYSPAAKHRNIAGHKNHPHYELVITDIRNLEQMRRNLSGRFDVIVHLAAKAGVRASIEEPFAYNETNVVGTQNLLELAREWRTPSFIFTSSSSVYGLNRKFPWSEQTTSLQPISPYASTKLSGESLGHVYSHLYGIQFTALRLFTVFGPRQRPDPAIHKFAELMTKGKPIPIYGDGSTYRDYIYVSDTITGLIPLDYWKSETIASSQYLGGGWLGSALANS
jgi:UDP-glucuronate 4-epimerase